ncbi:HAD family phosphatase [Sutterella sp.]|uniref:HAD family hydrolase n=1 Tax=Sutterella sp. TaxID=1981025 RepID=UPI0026DF031E|nr:HAD family phosphatase [Sutterella sp.]MDO5531107.1 HAD family phosphatase [Sutterella sp.]
MTDFRKLLLLDCDGVLADTEEISCGAVAAAFTEAGVPISTPEAVHLFTGTDRVYLTEWLIDHGVTDKEALAQAFARKDELTLRGIREELPPGPDTVAALERLAAKGVTLAVTSNSIHGRLELTLEKIGVLPLVEGRVFSAADVPRGKPAPDLHLLACRSCGFEPAEAVVIDDSTAGVRGGVAAGIRSVGFTRWAEDREAAAAKLRAAGACGVINSIGEIAPFLGL